LLIWRLSLGPLFIATLVGLCWLDYRAAWPGVYLLPLAVVLSLLAVGELLAMFRRRAAAGQPLPWVVYGGTLITVLMAGAPVWLPPEWSSGAVGRLGWLAIGLVAGLLVAIVGEMWRYESPPIPPFAPGKERFQTATENLALSSLAILYVGGLMGFLVQLRLLDLGGAGIGSNLGMLSLASLVLIVKLSDTGQYTAGRLFGKHKLAPKISPGKTWEGVVGGFVFAVLGAVCTLWLGAAMNANIQTWFAPFSIRSVVFFVVYPIALAAAGIVGDLAESMLKRDAGVKDSSSWMPGFGGVLDLLDSLLGAAPVAYVFWMLSH
jgi:phosphatidate cytidylyltransferase